MAHGYFMIAAEFMAAFKKNAMLRPRRNPWLELKEELLRDIHRYISQQFGRDIISRVSDRREEPESFGENLQGLLESQRRGR